MCERDVGLAAGGERERLSGADGDRLHRVPCLALEGGHQHVEQTRVLGARRGGKDDRAARRLRVRGHREEQRRERTEGRAPGGRNHAPTLYAPGNIFKHPLADPAAGTLKRFDVVRAKED